MVFGRLTATWRAIRHAWSTAVADELQRASLGSVRFGSGVLIRGADRIVAGSGVFIDHRAYLTTGDVNGRRGYIRIGSGVEIGPYCVLWGGGGIELGDNVHLGAHVHVTSQQSRRAAPGEGAPGNPFILACAPVRIEEEVLIYSGAIVVPGVTIGRCAVVAAGAVVTRDVPPYATVAGIPARVIDTLVSP